MKKFIFYKIKSVREYCLTFSWRFNAGFSSFFGTNAFTKKLFFYATLLLLGFGFAPNSYGQLVGGAAVNANFGTDGDAYANLLQFGNLGGPANTDDWFNTTYPGNGKGVIKQTDPIPTTPNTAFSFRQSETTPTAPFPFPIVPPSAPPYTGSYLWLDAVYGRDNYVKGGNAEKSYFAGSGDKNSDNPITWSIGTSGSVPPKDDIIDVFAHLRGEGIRLPFSAPGTSDPRPFTTLWGFAGASLVTTNGSKHIDFEFFRTALDEVEDLSIPNSTGLDGGRTAFTFVTVDDPATPLINEVGNVDQPGTIIISVDYEGGGSKPEVRIRVWIAEADLAGFNALPGRPFDIDPGSFEKGLQSLDFGYVRIFQKTVNGVPSGDTNIFGRVNNTASTLGPPWGTFEGPTPSPFLDFQTLQFVEIAINLTAFGLDKRGAQHPCANLLGSLLVKTRSSAGGQSDSFTSELKDFAGPYLFGNTGTTPIVSVDDKTACSGDPVDLTIGAITDSGPIHYYTTLINGVYSGEIIPTTPPDYIPTGTTTIYVRSESLTNPGCFGTSQFTVTVNAITPGVIAGSQTLCTPFDPAAFTSTTPGSGGGTITYQWQSSTTGCGGTFTDISTNGTGETYDAPAVSVTTYFRRVAISTLEGVACSAISNCLTVTPNAINPGVIAGDQTLCTPFNPAAFTSITAGTGGGEITYQWQISTTGCGGTFTDISTNGTGETYDAPAVSVTTYFRRVAISTLEGVACSANSNCLTVTPNAITPGTIAGDQIGCSPLDPAAFTSTTAGTGGGEITYQWQSNTTGCGGTFTDISTNGTGETYDAPAVSVTTYFRRVAISTLNLVACSANSNCLTVTPTGINPGEIAGSQILCSPFDPAEFTSVTPGSDHGTITYQWQSSTTSNSTGFADIGGANLPTYNAPQVAVKTWFRRVATSDVSCAGNSNVLVVTPNAINPGVIAGDQTLCTPFNPAAFTSITAGTGGGEITYQWQISTTGCGGTFTDISTNGTGETYDAPAVSVTTYFRRVAISTLEGVACSGISNCLTVIPNAINPGVIAGDQTVCIGDDPAAFTSTTAGTGGGEITYQWQSNTTGCGAVFTDIAGADSPTYNPGVASVTTYYRRVAISTLNDVVCSDNSNCLTVTAQPCGGHIFPTATTCCNFATGTVTELENVCYTASAPNNGSVTNAIPGVFFYYSNMVAPAASFIIDVTQFNDGDLSKLFNVQNDNQIRLFTSNCEAASFTGSIINGGSGARLVVTGATPGATYIISIKYDVKSIIGATYSGPTPVSTYTFQSFTTVGANPAVFVSGSEGTIDAVAGCSDNTPLPGNCDLTFSAIAPSTIDPIAPTASKTELAGFTASPVPFKDQLTIRYNFDYVSDVKIEVFDTQGILIYSGLDTNSYLNKEITLNLNAKKGQEQVYVVKLTTNQGSSTKKVMSSR